MTLPAAVARVLELNTGPDGRVDVAAIERWARTCDRRAVAAHAAGDEEGEHRWAELGWVHRAAAQRAQDPAVAAHPGFRYGRTRQTSLPR